MDKKTIAFLKNKFPRLFLWITKSPFLAWIASELDRGRYIYCMAIKKPYFGTVFLAGQTWQERKSSMIQLIKEEIKRSGRTYFSVLEIGSWAGDSAVLWADTIKSSGCKGMVLCVDPWEPYIRNKECEKTNAATIVMDHALRKGKVFNLFLHNIEASNHMDIIYPIKGFSNRILPLLHQASFDMIYIDGDHSYSGIKSDLAHSTGILREGGILCGDDFDISIHDVDRDFAEKYKEVNAVVDPKTKEVYHPGVCLAVSEFFGAEPSCYNGFWVMRKAKTQWEEVSLESGI